MASSSSSERLNVSSKPPSSTNNARGRLLLPVWNCRQVTSKTPLARLSASFFAARASHVGDLHALDGAGCAQDLLDRARRLIPTAAGCCRNEQLEKINRLRVSGIDGRERQRQSGAEERGATHKIATGEHGVSFPRHDRRSPAPCPAGCESRRATRS